MGEKIEDTGGHAGPPLRNIFIVDNDKYICFTK